MPSSHSRKIITQDDVAREAGVTRSIVSYVINNGPRRVSVETRNRVLAAIKTLGYRPNKHAQILSSPDESLAGNYIGIILSGNYMFMRPFYGSILASIHEYAHEIGWHIRFIRVYDDFCDPTLFDELIHPNEIRGVVLLGLDHVLSKMADDTVLVDEIVRRVERVVCIDWEWPGVPSIKFDRQHAAFQATTHLLTLGRQSIAYIGPEDKRVAGFQQALWERGIAPHEDLMAVADDTIMGYSKCDAMLNAGAVVDAVCTGCDDVGIGVLNCLQQHGFNVPADVAVASIDNIDIAAYTVPALTTVDVPKYEIGRHAVNILTSDRAWQASASYAINVPTQLVVRESSVAHVAHAERP